MKILVRCLLMLLSVSMLASCDPEESLLTEIVDNNSDDGNKDGDDANKDGDNGNKDGDDGNKDGDDAKNMIVYTGFYSRSHVDSEKEYNDWEWDGSYTSFGGFTVQASPVPQTTEEVSTKVVSTANFYCTLSWNGADQASISIKRGETISTTSLSCTLDRVYIHPTNQQSSFLDTNPTHGHTPRTIYKGINVTDTKISYWTDANSTFHDNPLVIKRTYSTEPQTNTSDETITDEYSYNLSVGKINDYKYIMSNSEVEFTFDPIGGRLVQTKGYPRYSFNLTKQL